MLGPMEFQDVVRRRRMVRSYTSEPVDPEMMNAAKQPVAMVPCARCGVHVPGSDALANEAGELFCSEAHRRASSRRP